MIHHVRRIAGLRNPARDVPAVVLYIELQEAVRIGPKPFRDRSLHGDPLIVIKSRISMMRPCGNDCKENEERPGNALHDSVFHRPSMKFLAQEPWERRQDLWIAGNADPAPGS